MNFFIELRLLLQRLNRAIFDIGVSFSPVFLLLFLLFVTGDLHSMPTRTDFAYLATTLFAEGWWRVRTLKADAVDRSAALQLIGFWGTISGSVVAAVMTLAEMQKYKCALAPLVSSEPFSTAKFVVLLGAIGYGLFVRYDELGAALASDELARQTVEQAEQSKAEKS